MYSEAIAALVGAVVGALIVLIPQYVGKLRITFTRLRISPMLHSIDREGIEKLTLCTLDEARYLDLMFVADIHNSKAYPLSYRDVALEFVCGDKCQAVNIQERNKLSKLEPTYILNQPSKTMVQYLFECKIRGENLAILKAHNGKANYYLRLVNHKGHKERFPILEIEILQPN